MDNALQPKPLYAVGPMFSEALGLDWCRDRHEVIEKINHVRELLYIDDDMPPLFTECFDCIQIECFPEDCLHTCACGGATYFGVTLPLGHDGLINVWDDHEPLKTFSKWYEGRDGRITKTQGPCDSVTLMNRTFPTERSMEKPDILSVYSHDPLDDGKTVTISTDEGILVFKLEADRMFKGDDVVHSIKSVQLPVDLKGQVSLYAGEKEISCYGPGEALPCFKRLKISKPCPSGQVLVQSYCKFRDICFDHDIVEVGSRVILLEAAKYLRYGFTGTETDEINKGFVALARMKQLIKGAVKRSMGESKEDMTMWTQDRLVKSHSLYNRRRRR